MWCPHISMVLCLVLCVQLAFAQQPNYDGCTAFSSNGLAAAQYQYYRFYDFRQIRSSNPTNTGSKGAQYKVVSDKKWKDDWYIRDYPRNSPGGTSIPVDFVTDKVYITDETDSSQNASTHLSLNTERRDALTQASGEITYKEFNISHGSFRVMSRVHGAPGAVAGIFTYLNDTQESDIEIFTRAPTTHVQYSNQPSSLGSPTWDPIPGATVNITMPDGDVITDWHVHRLDWTAARSVFFFDDVQMNETTLHVPVADPPSAFYIDMWSANSSWSGSMDIGKNATLDILWIEMLFNTTAEVKPAGTQRVCAVANGTSMTAPSSSGVSPRLGSPTWLVGVVVGVFTFVLLW